MGNIFDAIADVIRRAESPQTVLFFVAALLVLAGFGLVSVVKSIADMTRGGKADKLARELARERADKEHLLSILTSVDGHQLAVTTLPEGLADEIAAAVEHYSNRKSVTPPYYPQPEDTADAAPEAPAADPVRDTPAAIEQSDTGAREQAQTAKATS